MGFSDSSILLKIALVILGLASILQIVGLATPNWSSALTPAGDASISSSFGLWKFCFSALGKSDCDSYPDAEDWLKICRAFAVIGVLAVIGATVLEVLCTLALSKATHKIVFILATLAAFVGAASIILAAIIWGAKTSDLGTGITLDWSFALSILAGVLAGIGGLLVALDICKG
ncbi:uncharacterized protein LOC110459122 [Mizuhopecten yessoensis]|uniref:Claudin n=1 Tax=Mizuhopecten yessoensis TaxID=6573 RepID=A0A210R6T7_MIZYE|nr:uncharacterized protein LOC110459122 [Mizuhopecten yessoensis]OWF56759.1 hypothetical protein KP79_PYT00022 [Mizuhopecten yessoensis]